MLTVPEFHPGDCYDSMPHRLGGWLQEVPRVQDLSPHDRPRRCSEGGRGSGPESGRGSLQESEGSCPSAPEASSLIVTGLARQPCCSLLVEVRGAFRPLESEGVWGSGSGATFAAVLDRRSREADRRRLHESPFADGCRSRSGAGRVPRSAAVSGVRVWRVEPLPSLSPAFPQFPAECRTQTRPHWPIGQVRCPRSTRCWR